MVFKESRTHANLEAALEEKLLSCARYQLWARLAHAEALGEIGEALERAARHELEHARIFLRQLHAGEPPGTARNLEEAIRAERARWSDSLRAGARTARAEGYVELAQQMDEMGDIARQNEETFTLLLRDLAKGELLEQPARAHWVCTGCGAARYAVSAPARCPLCGRGREAFRLRDGRTPKA